MLKAEVYFRLVSVCISRERVGHVTVMMMQCKIVRSNVSDVILRVVRQ